MLTSSASVTIVIDSNIAVWAVVPGLAAPNIDPVARLQAWRASGLQLCAPMLWLAECTSAIRTIVYAGRISLVEGRSALADLLILPVEARPLTAVLCQSAFDWAGRIGQAKAYDSFYLALADELGAEFWTADRRLVNAAGQLGLGWVHWIGEP